MIEIIVYWSKTRRVHRLRPLGGSKGGTIADFFLIFQAIYILIFRLIFLYHAMEKSILRVILQKFSITEEF